jgi:hypothetical protein
MSLRRSLMGRERGLLMVAAMVVMVDGLFM